MDFGEAKRIRPAPMRDNEPKGTEKLPLKAVSGLNALASLHTCLFYNLHHIWCCCQVICTISAVLNL